MRARLAPRQKWGPPPPKAMWGLGSRATSKVSGSSKTSSSRLAEAWKKTTLSPAAISVPLRVSVAHGGAAEVHDGRDEAQHLLDRGGQQAAVVEQALPLVGVLEEGVHGAGHEVAGRLVAGDREQEEEQLELEVAEALALDLDRRSARS